MSQTWITSDTHLNHDQLFIWGARGFNSVEEMNEAIIERWNSIVQPDDIVYHLGDVMLGDLESGLALVRRLNGHIYLAIGNHDTDNRVQAFKQCDNIVDIQFGYRLKVGHHTLLLTHYPMVTSDVDNSTNVWNLYGHTHQKTLFYNNQYFMYNVGVDSHDCYPILLQTALTDIIIERNKEKEKML